MYVNVNKVKYFPHQEEKRLVLRGFGKTVLTVHFPAKGQNPKIEETTMIYFNQRGKMNLFVMK